MTMKRMNYSGLTATLRRIHLATEKSQSSGIPVKEILEMDQGLRKKLHANNLENADRRNFLKSAGIVGLGAGLGMRGETLFAGPNNGSAPKVAIIGAGAGGMRTAHRLTQYGIPSTLYEARSRPGGRIYSNDQFSNGRVIEWGGEFISTEHTALRNLAHQLNLELEDQNKLSVGDEEVYAINGQLYSEANLMDEWVDGLYGSLKDALMAAPWQPLYNTDHTQAHRDYDKISARQWLEDVGYGSSHWVHKLLMTDLVSEYGILEENSALNLIYIMGYNNRGSGGLPLAGTDERLHVVGGNDKIIRGMETDILNYRSDAIETGRKLVAIRGDFGGPYDLEFEDGHSIEKIEALVLALPYGLIRELDIDSRITGAGGFTDEKNDSIQQMVQSDNGKVQMEFTDRHWDMALNIQGEYIHSNGRAYSEPDGFINSWESEPGNPSTMKVLSNYTGGARGRKLKGRDYLGVASSADVSRILSDWEAIWPGISSKYTGNAVVSNWWDHPLTKGAFVSPVIGTMTSWWGAQWETQGNIFFAGEACDPEYWSYMNGAILSGERVAKEISQL
jgi:monoamine oxidase